MAESGEKKKGSVMKPSMKLGIQFTVEQENFIVRKYHEGLQDVQVKRAFRNKFGQSRILAQTPAHHFYRVYEAFQKKVLREYGSLKNIYYMIFITLGIREMW